MKYEEPMLEVLMFNHHDVIRTSTLVPGEEDDGGGFS